MRPEIDDQHHPELPLHLAFTSPHALPLTPPDPAQLPSAPAAPAAWPPGASAASTAEEEAPRPVSLPSAPELQGGQGTRLPHHRTPPPSTPAPTPNSGEPPQPRPAQPGPQLFPLLEPGGGERPAAWPGGEPGAFLPQEDGK